MIFLVEKLSFRWCWYWARPEMVLSCKHVRRKVCWAYETWWFHFKVRTVDKFYPCFSSLGILWKQEKGNPFSQIVVVTIFNCAIPHCWSKKPDWGNLPPFCDCLTMPFPVIMPYKCASTRGWGFNNVWIIYLIKMIIFSLWTYRNLKFVYWKCQNYPWKFH